MEFYASLNDAAVHNPRYASGFHYRIYFLRDSAAEAFFGGSSRFTSEDQIRKPANLKELTETHSLIGSIAAKERDPLEAVYALMQSAKWCPEGECVSYLPRLGVYHFDLSPGDVVEFKNVFYMLTNEVPLNRLRTTKPRFVPLFTLTGQPVDHPGRS